MYQLLCQYITTPFKISFAHPVSDEFASALDAYEVSRPHRVTDTGEFLSATVHHRVRRDTTSWPRNTQHSTDNIHYRVELSDATYHLTLRPNTRLLSPSFVVEERKYNFGNVSDSVIERHGAELCHYTGSVDGHEGSLAAVATCNGLVSWKILVYAKSAGKYLAKPVVFVVISNGKNRTRQDN